MALRIAGRGLFARQRTILAVHDQHGFVFYIVYTASTLRGEREKEKRRERGKGRERRWVVGRERGKRRERKGGGWKGEGKERENERGGDGGEGVGRERETGRRRKFERERGG